MKRLLIVDDDYSMRLILQETMSANNYEVHIAKDGKAALKLLETTKVELVITDLMMPEIDGIKLMELVKKNDPDIGFLFITAYGTVETAVNAIQKGAFDFITKPFSTSHIKTRVEQFFEYKDLREENKQLRTKLTNFQKYNRIVGVSKAMKDVLDKVDVVAGSDVPVLITGESGTGKELIAREIHSNSNRASKPFICVNCATIPDTLFESTLFGHERGSFTSAVKQQKGLFEEANGGTILLDEINTIPIGLQAKLLRVLQEGTIMRVGSPQEIRIDVRIIATTNKILLELIDLGEFRDDLYYRLNVFPIILPALRQRSGDIPVLALHLLEKQCERNNFEKKELSRDVLELFEQYNWPGNVREMENMILRAIISSKDKSSLGMEYFSFDEKKVKPVENNLNNSVTSIADMERMLIFNALKKTNNNRAHAAKILGITTRTLRNKLHLYEAEGVMDSSLM